MYGSDSIKPPGSEQLPIHKYMINHHDIFFWQWNNCLEMNIFLGKERRTDLFFQKKKKSTYTEEYFCLQNSEFSPALKWIGIC